MLKITQPIFKSLYELHLTLWSIHLKVKIPLPENFLSYARPNKKLLIMFNGLYVTALQWSYADRISQKMQQSIHLKNLKDLHDRLRETLESTYETHPLTFVLSNLP